MAEIPLVVRLRSGGSAPPGERLLGGKAAALARLVAGNEPVPSAAVLTTAAYEAVAGSPTVRTLTRALLGDRADVIDDDEIDRAFLDAPLSGELRRSIDLISELFDGPLAVRSSATEEDQERAAFAGQYRTILDVWPDELERAVRLVWASLWHRGPRAYRLAQGVDRSEPTMAVLVMEMIDPTTAGVLFTRDPVGDESNVRLETVAGCGDALVSGAVTPDAHVWPRGEAALDAALLGPAFGELVERGLALETGWGIPLDIEFAVDRAGRLWLVQARPVTALAATVTRPPTLTRAGIAEMLPGVLAPLLQETAGRHVDEGFRNLLAGVGADIGAMTGPFVRFDRSQALLDLELLRRATATVPGGSVAALDRGYSADAPHGGEPARANSTAQALRVMRQRRDAVLESEIVVQAVDRLVEDDGRRDGDGLRELLARWERVQDFGARATTAEMRVAALATAAYEGVQLTLSRYVEADRARELAQRLTSGPRGRSDPLDRCIRASGVDPSQQLTGEAWDAVLARSGSRSVFGGPTWEDDRDLAWMAYCADRPDAATTSGEDLLGSIDRPRGSRRPGLGRVRRRFVRREIADATELLDRREHTKRALLDLGGVAHRLTCEIGGLLAARGELLRADAVWLLSPDELRTACIIGTVPCDLTPRGAALAGDRGAETAATAATDSEQGWPAAPGTARGRAVVVDAPRAGAIGRGDVLVARSTDAGWVPLFTLAAAIVVEDGGPLSHAAIVARELGVPAVVNLPGVVERIRSAGPDVVVDVDGSTGTVTIVDDRIPLAPVITPPDDEPRLGVFVTGLIGASALFGVVVSVTEAVSSGRGIRRTRARAAAPAAIAADVVRHGTDATQHTGVGLAPARRYAHWALATVVVGLLLGAIAVTEYVAGGPAGRVMWLVTALSILPVTLIGAALLHQAAVRWPDVPATVRRITPTQRPHTTLRHHWHEMPTLHRRWLVVFASIATVLLVLNTAAPTALRAFDEPLYDAIGLPDPDPWGPDWFGMYLGRPQVVIPVALLIALFTVRCRVLAIAYPVTIVFGGLLNLGLGALVGKDRPPLGAHADQTDSFPSGHAIEVTLLLGLVPLAVAVLVRSRWFGIAMRVVASGVLTVMLIDGLREGSHWPTDHLGGFAIAMTAVILVHALARMPSLHRSCTRCPALSLLPETVEEPRGDP